MEGFIDINNLVIFMTTNALDDDPLFSRSITALLEHQITEWEFVCACQYITDQATIAFYKRISQ